MREMIDDGCVIGAVIGGVCGAVWCVRLHCHV